MTYEAHLRKMYEGVDLCADDLFLLDASDIQTLPDRVSSRALSAALRAAPALWRVWITRHPPIAGFLEEALETEAPLTGESDALVDQLVWEIAEMLVYHRYPDIYDERSNTPWDLTELTDVVDLTDGVVVDAGAGTGRIAFPAATEARWVFAVEPVGAFRRYMRAKAIEESVSNLYVLDGTLNAIPLPDDFVDVLVTCRAINWSLREELTEIERVVRAGGVAVHLGAMTGDDDEWDGPLHDTLTSSRWGYECVDDEDDGGSRRKYVKRF